MRPIQLSMWLLPKRFALLRFINPQCCPRIITFTTLINRANPNKSTEFLLQGGFHVTKRHLSYSCVWKSSKQKENGCDHLDTVDDCLKTKGHNVNCDNIDPGLKSVLVHMKCDSIKETNAVDENMLAKENDELQSTSTIDSSQKHSDLDMYSNYENFSATDDDFRYDYRVGEDIEEYDYKDARDMIQQQVRPEKVLPVSLERGKSGVFDLDELLIMLENLGAENIVAIPVPPEAHFCDHMVVVSSKSKRHLQAINDELLWIHKRKKSAKDPHLVIEGLNKSDWCAMDMGNIILHIFFGPQREYYDIESLWTLGPDADPKCQDLGHDPYELSPEKLFWLGTSSNTNTDPKEKQEADGINNNGRPSAEEGGTG